MNTVLEIVVALLAAMGLLLLCWLLFSRLFYGGGYRGSGCIVVPAQGSGETLEGEVRRALWLRGGQCALAVIIADRGLDPAGQAAASALLARYPGLVICPAEHLGRYVSQL